MRRLPPNFRFLTFRRQQISGFLVEHTTHRRSELIEAERFGEKVRTRIKHAVVNDGVASESRRVKDGQIWAEHLDLIGELAARHVGPLQYR